MFATGLAADRGHFDDGGDGGQEGDEHADAPVEDVVVIFEASGKGGLADDDHSDGDQDEDSRNPMSHRSNHSCFVY